ncbi:hypothetical protein ACE8D4_20925 [Xanthomonas perforans]|uniref:hypothetical protein n=1 Tax=Xanthomonas perforans TaxID=442694 RepID=UPI003B66EB8C
MANVSNYDELKKVFLSVVGRLPTPEETEGLLRWKDAMGFQWNDALFSVIMALEHYKSYFLDMPKEMQKACDFMLGEAQGKLSEQVKIATDGVNAVYAKQRERYAEMSKQAGEQIIAKAIENLQGNVRDTVAAELKSVERESGRAIDAVGKATIAAVDRCRHVSDEFKRMRWLSLATGLVMAAVGGMAGAWAVNWLGKEEVTDAQRGNMAVGELVSSNWSKLSPTTQRELEKLLKE